MDIIQSLNWRYATKVFDSTKKVNDKDLETITESLRLTASSFGLQAWKFLIIKNQEVKKSLLAHSWGQSQVVDCSHHIVLCCPTDLTLEDVDIFINDIAETRSQSTHDLQDYAKNIKNVVKNYDQAQKQIWMKNQVYIALGNLLTTCAVMGIDACPMEGFKKDQYDEVLGLKEQGLMSVVCCPIGYRSSSDKYANAKKVRFNHEKIIKTIN